MEYNAASEVSIPRFIYIVEENQPWIPANVDEGDKKEKLKVFKETLRKRHICQPFTNKDQLATCVVADVGRHIAMRNATRVGPNIPVNDIGLESLYIPAEDTPDKWNRRRNAVKKAHRDIYITHVIQPSTKKGQKFEVFIYLIRQKSTDFSDVLFAEFFLGKYWGNKVFPAVEQNGFIGIATAAYGTFLCLCRVTFRDGTHLYLDRFIDFEAQRTGGKST